MSVNPRSIIARYAPLLPAIRTVLACIGIAYCVAVLLGFAPYSTSSGERTFSAMGDAHAYWSANLADPYADAQLAGPNAFLYSPAFLQALAPLQLLPWPAFAAGWFVLHLAVLWRLRALWMLAIPFVADDVIRGNVHTFYAGALVWPIALPLLPLTKVTPAVAWFGLPKGLLVRATVATLAITLASLVISANLWLEWFGVLARSSTVAADVQVIRIPLAYRLPIAIGLAVAGRRWNWLLAVSVLVALPNIWPSAFATLAAIPLLRQGREKPKRMGHPPPAHRTGHDLPPTSQVAHWRGHARLRTS